MAIIQKINQIEIAENVSMICGIFFLIVAIFFAFKEKIYQSIYRISGMKRKKGIRKLKREWMKTRVHVILVGILSGAFLLTATQNVYADTETMQKSDKIFLSPLGKQKEENNIFFYDEGVTGTASLEIESSGEEYIDEDTIHIYGIPLDEVAKQVVDRSENEDTNGYFEILGWNLSEKQGKIQISFHFQEQGKWKLSVSFQSILESDSEESIISKNNDEKEDSKNTEETGTTETIKNTEETGTTENVEDVNETKTEEVYKDTDGAESTETSDNTDKTESLNNKNDETETTENGGKTETTESMEKNKMGTETVTVGTQNKTINTVAAQKGRYKIAAVIANKIDRIKIGKMSVIKNGSQEEENQKEESDFQGEEDNQRKESREYEYFSDEFVIDKEFPTLSVTYDECININDQTSSPENVNLSIKRNLPAISSSACEVFAGETGLISVKIQEDYFSATNVSVKIYEIFYEDDSKKEVTEQYYKGYKVWKICKNTATLQLHIKKEGHYCIQIEYTDYTGHALTTKENNETSVCMSEGKYEGPMYTVDQTAPVFETFFCQTNSSHENGKRSYYKDPLDVCIVVKEENFNQEDFLWEDTLTWADGTMISPSRSEKDYVMVWTSYYENEVRINQGRMYIDTEANHTISGQIVDSSHLQSERKTGQWTYDVTAPEIEIVLDDTGIYVPYDFYQYYSQEDISATVTAKDKISGIWAIRYYYAQNGIMEGENIRKESSIINESTETQEKNLTEFSVKIAPTEKNFKGCLYVQAEDFSGVSGGVIKSAGLISESAEMHRMVSNLTINVSEADYTDESTKTKYYRHPMTIVATATDDHSGIANIKMKAEGTSVLSEEEVILQASKSYVEKEDITYAGSLSMKIESEEFAGSTPENPICVEVVMTDNARNKASLQYEEYKLVMDNISPEIEVSYNTNEATNDKYYNQSRVANVVVRDWNFNKDSVVWDISGSNDKYTVGEWKDEGEAHQCEIVFFEDGDDYQIKLSLSDYAGNQASWDEDQPFCIDKTAPVLSMNMDDSNVKNEYYYASSKLLSFYVADNHIDTENAACYINQNEKSALDGTGDTEDSGDKPLKLFSDGEGEYHASICFEEEGEYLISFSCVDLAGNVSETEIPMKFVIDLTLPEIKISGIEEGTTYTDEIYPGISVLDENLDQRTLHAVIERVDGIQYIQAIDSDGKYVDNEGRWQYKGKDIPHIEGTDGIYRLSVYAEDLAGNVASLENNGLLFYMNRFGIFYEFGERLKSAIEKGYINSEEDMIVSEYNVNPVENKIILLKDNKERSEIDIITNSFDNDILYSQGKKGWNVKELLMEKENFQEEGTYQITIQSTGYGVKNNQKIIIDETTNELEGQPIQFIVDKTPPVVQIGGLDQKLYQGDTRIFTVTVMDNYEFTYMDLKIQYEGKEKKERLIHIEADDLNENHSIVEELEDYEGKQTITCQAWDMAGNCRDTSVTGESVNWVVTDNTDNTDRAGNQMLQAGYQKPVPVWTWKIIMTGIAGVGLLLLFTRKFRSR